MVLKRVGKISILLIVVLLLFAACSKPASQPLTAQDFLDLGEKYLLDLDYEQALVQFLKAIEIDPMNPRGYTGAAEAYVGLGDISNAISVLEQGLRATNDRDIESRIQELHDIQEDSQNSSSQEQTESPTNADTTIPTDNTGADSTAEPDINTYGNSSDNIKNGGLAAIQGDHIYYIGNSMFNIHSMKVDGNDIRQLNDSPSFLINVIGDWIYYVSPDDSWNNFQIYKMKLDGSEQEMISDDSTFYMIVVGERIYYINNSDGNSIYRINIDGSNRIKLNDDPTDCFVVLDGLMIFYYTRGNNHEQQGSTVTYVDSGIYRMGIDGTDRVRISTQSAENINRLGDMIYYTYPAFQNNTIFRNDIGGHNAQRLTQSADARGVNSTRHGIFFTDREGEDGIYCINLDGTETRKVSNDNVKEGTINIVGNWIFYGLEEGWEVLSTALIYRMKLDGSEKQLLWELDLNHPRRGSDDALS